MNDRTMTNNVEYIYIKKVNSTAVKVGSTTDWKTRYRPQPDQLTEDFEKNDYIAVFECNLDKRFQIETEFKKKFKEYHAEREIYANTPISLEKYKHWLITHKEIIKEIKIKCEKNKM